MANPTRRPVGPTLRAHSPSRLYTSPALSSSFFQNRSPSPTRVNLSSVRFSIDSRSITVIPNNQTVKKRLQQTPKRMCMCSPTSHPGSFRCSLHKNNNNKNNDNTMSYPSNRLNARRSAMTNSLVRIGTVEGGDLVKRALAALIRPSSHQQRRRTAFQPRPSRLSVMMKAEDPASGRFESVDLDVPF